MTRGKQPVVLQSHILYEFKIRHPLQQRTADSQEIMLRVPDKVPVIAEEVSEMTTLPQLARRKLLVPRLMTAGQLVHVLRGRLHLLPDVDLLVVMGERRVQTTDFLGHIYDRFHDPDGFLYVAYAADDHLSGPKFLIRVGSGPPPPPTTPASSEDVETPSAGKSRSTKSAKSIRKTTMNKAASAKSVAKSITSGSRDPSAKRQTTKPGGDDEAKKKKESRKFADDDLVKPKSSQSHRSASVKRKTQKE